jgi:type II secretory pathway predicted ATPase ExeA/tetratricopeptide (TPR) repeat protein
MYTEFYGLTERPFALSPSSRFLYLGETHREALALLTYGVTERKGFALLTGEVGTGKTTIVHALLAGLDPAVHTVHLSNPLLSPREFLGYLGRKALGRAGTSRSKAEFLLDFENFLADSSRSGKGFLLIIDEAHKLSFELLEEIRLLSNMETAEEKRINVFLVGQPELRERLRDRRCKALFQRIGIHHHLEPLDEKSVAEYLRIRLRAAGARSPEKIFPESVVKAIHHYSKGYPRAVNNISDNLLLLGYARGTKKITAAMVTECCADMSPEASPHGEGGEEREPAEESPAAPRSSSTASAGYAVVLAFLVAALGLTIGLVKTDMPGEDRGSVKTDMPDEDRVEVQPEPSAVLEEGEGDTLKWIPSEEAPGLTASEEPGLRSERQEGEEPPRVADPSPERTGLTQPPPSEAPGDSWKRVTVEEGQTLRELAMEVYGRGDESTLTRLKEKNPLIEDINVIHAGQEIAFPPPSLEEPGPGSQPTARLADSPQPDNEAELQGDIYDRIDRELLAPLRQRRPETYRAFWEGLLLSDTRESADERVSHFVREMPETESAAGPDPAEGGLLHPLVLRAYARLSAAEPLRYAPLLRDSVICRETWEGDLTLQGEPYREPLESTALHKLACSRLEAGRLEEAGAALDRILERGPPGYEVWNNRAVLYLRTGEVGLAQRDLTRAIERDPTRPEAFNNMGVAYAKKKAYPDAASYFLHASRVDPAFPEAPLNGVVLYGQYWRNADKAAAPAQDCLRRGGTFPRRMLERWLGCRQRLLQDGMSNPTAAASARFSSSILVADRVPMKSLRDVFGMLISSSQCMLLSCLSPCSIPTATCVESPSKDE